jgi:hypothetical protein
MTDDFTSGFRAGIEKAAEVAGAYMRLLLSQHPAVAKTNGLLAAEADGDLAEQIRSLLPEGSEGWRTTEGVDRENMPGTHIGWLVGWKEHSGTTWRREGQAILTLNNTGHLGYSKETMKHAMWLLDMDAVDAVPLFRPLPSPPTGKGE